MTHIYTKSDVRKFIRLLKEGLKHGERKSLSVSTIGGFDDNLGIEEPIFIRLEFHCHVDPSHLDDLIQLDIAENDIDDIMSELNG